jgi:hypothetical protein
VGRARRVGNIAGEESGSDINLYGGDGGAGVANQGSVIFHLGGYGGDGPLSDVDQHPNRTPP